MALPAVDWVSAASLTDLETVVVEQIKPANAWAGTPAEQEFDLPALTEATVIHEGPVRGATTKFPKNGCKRSGDVCSFNRWCGIYRNTTTAYNSS